MGRKGAKFVLGVIEKTKNKMGFSDEVILALVERAGDEPAQVNKPAESVLMKLALSPEPQREQAAPLHDGSVSAAPDHVTTSAQPMVAGVPQGEVYEIEE